MSTYDDVTTEWITGLPLLCQERGKHWRWNVDHSEDVNEDYEDDPIDRPETDNQPPEPPQRASFMLVLGALLVALGMQIIGTLTFLAAQHSYQVAGLWGAVGSILGTTAVIALALVLFSRRN